MRLEEYEALIEGARNDAKELNRLVGVLQASSEPGLNRLHLRAKSLLFMLRRTAAQPAVPTLAAPASLRPHWLSELGIVELDGRPLYRYHLSDDAFRRLQIGLRQSAPAFLGEPEPKLAAKFALWAAEWFRRCYDGSGRRWQALAEPLGLDPDAVGWTEWADKGLRWWNIRPLIINRTHHRLAALARQGGFPIAALEGQGSGWAPRFLERLVGTLLSRPAEDGDAAMQAANDVADELMDSLVPSTWRHTEIRVLAADLALAVLRWRRVAEQNGVPAGSLVSIWLDEHHPKWRDDMPIRVGTEAGKALIDGLVKTTERTPVGSVAKIERQLFVSTDNWWEGIELKLEGLLRDARGRAVASGASSEWNRLRLFPSGEFARYVSGELAVADPDDDGMWIARQTTLHPALNLTSAVPVSVELRGGAQRVAGPFIVHGGDAVSASVRVFEPISGEDPPQAFRLIGTGSRGYGPDTVYVDLPHRWTCEPRSPASRIECVAQSEKLGRRLWRVQGEASIRAPDGDVYLVRTGQKGEERDCLEFVGQLVPGMTNLDVDVPVFLGPPKLELRKGSRRSAPLSGEIRWRPRGQSAWLPFAGSMKPGPCEFSWRDAKTGHVRDRRDAVVLPDRFRIERKPQNGAIDIVVSGWPGGVRSDGSEQVAPHCVRFPLQGSTRTSCSLELLDGSPTPVVLSVPLPHHAWIVDWSGAAVPRDGRVALSTINRYVARTDGRCELTAQLLDRDRRPVPHCFVTWCVEEELPLSTIRDDLVALLRPHGDIHASVKLDFHDGRNNFWYVQEFDTPLVVQSDRWRFDGAMSDDAPRVVGRLASEPAREHDLGPFDSSARQDGLEPPELTGDWLVYLRARERVLSAPRLVRGAPGSAAPEAALARAAGIADHAARNASLGAACASVLAAPDSPESRAFVRDLIQLALSLDGLPPSTFDVFLHLSRQPRLAATMLFEAAEKDVEALLRLSQGLPFDWSLVPAEDWSEAAATRFRFLIERFPDEVEVVAELIGSRRKTICEANPELAPHLEPRKVQKDLHTAANEFLNRSQDRIPETASPFRPERAGVLPGWRVGEHFWRPLDAPVVAARAARGRVTLHAYEIACIKDIGRRHPRWFREAYAIALGET
ncbi:hypothetical protein F6X38_15560 [Aureimonas leprariae]|uniref:Uncharacterized protein n=2 Tax=Plantimonas leprariae TaxID=2615207 RepID=A0A7V7TVM0_9HYPH|nr:hypothetical protein F6X38_15560 [Aureimonas leprariae]